MPRKSNRKSLRKSNRKGLNNKQGGARDFYNKFILTINSINQLPINEIENSINIMRSCMELNRSRNNFYNIPISLQQLLNDKIINEQKLISYMNQIEEFIENERRFSFNLNELDDYLSLNELNENNMAEIYKVITKRTDIIKESKKDTQIKLIKNSRIYIYSLNQLLIKNIFKCTSNLHKIIIEKISNIEKFHNELKDIKKKSINEKEQYRIEIFKINRDFSDDITPNNVLRFIQERIDNIKQEYKKVTDNKLYKLFEQLHNNLEELLPSQDEKPTRGGFFGKKKEDKIKKFNALLAKIGNEINGTKIKTNEDLRSYITGLITEFGCDEWIKIQDTPSMQKVYSNINSAMKEIKKKMMYYHYLYSKKIIMDHQ